MDQAVLSRSRPASPSTSSLAIRFEGALFAHHSLAVVNRELAACFADRGHRIDFTRVEPDAFQPRNGSHARLAEHLARPNRSASDVVIRHHWPPNFARSSNEKLIVIQPWEYGSLPRAWVEPIQRGVDEVWVPSTWVRETYLRAGIDSERVVVVPNGADTQRFHPGAVKRIFGTTKTLKFLFVGGALPRKGVHILLEAWKRAFDSSDDVALIVKDFGAGTVYAGQTLAALVRKAAATPGSAQIVYSDETLADHEMPGLFTGADVLVHPYLAEGFGLPIAEAMACALPVVVTGGGPALDFCDDVTTYLIPAREVRMSEARVGSIELLERGIVFEPDVDALAAILRDIARHPDRARAKGRLARQKIRAGFTWEHAADVALTRLALACTSGRAPLVVPSRGIDAAPTSLSAKPSNQAQSSARATTSRAEAIATTSTPVVGSSCSASSSLETPLVFGAAPFNWSGYARITRMLLPQLKAHGVVTGLQAYASDRAFLAAQSPQFLSGFRDLLSARPEDAVHVAFHPPVGWDGYRFFSNACVQNPTAIAHVGFTMFETDRLPSGWAEELSRLDRVMVPCRFNVETFVAAGVPREKIVLFQPGLDLSRFTRDVAKFELAGAPAFTFLSVFQWTKRKGWDVLLEAFVRAFRRSDDVRLVIRAYPGERKDPPLGTRIAEHLAALGVDPDEAPRIELIENFVSENDLPSLYAAADAYVLPTRGEGFGLPFLEAMAAGLPTIGTRWGGHLDFLDDDVGYTIPIDGLEPVDAEQTAENPYYEADHHWARPSVEHTSRLMRRVFEQRDEARAKGERARERVFAEWSAAHGAERFARIVEGIHADARKAPRRRSPSSAAVGAPIMWSGPLLDMSGYADEGRDFVMGLDAIGARVRSLPVAWGRAVPLSSTESEVLSRTSGAVLFEAGVAVHHGFGCTMKPVPGMLATVGRTMFETDRAPASWIEPLSLLDEVWVPSAWQKEGFVRSGLDAARVQVIHGTLDAQRFERLPSPLAVAGARSFNFLSIFDWSRRKGWDLLVRAFVESFRAGDDVALILKVHSSSGLQPREIQAKLRDFLRRELGRGNSPTPTILLLSESLSRDDLVRLYVRCDAYVMPSRGEGWGRPLLEAMAAGLPTIGTRFGGNQEFMDDENSFLVDASIVPVPDDAVKEQPLYAGHRWGEPDLSQLKDQLVRAHRDRAHARAVGAVARERALTRFDRRIVARDIVERVKRLSERSSKR